MHIRPISVSNLKDNGYNGMEASIINFVGDRNKYSDSITIMPK